LLVASLLALLVPLRSPAKAAEAKRVVVTLPIIASVVREVVPASWSVETLANAGKSEHESELTASQAATIATCDLFVHVGLGLDVRAQAILQNHPRAGRKVVRFAKIAGVDESHESADHNHADDHQHGDTCDHSTDPHLWLDADLMRKLIEAVQHAAIELSPDDQEIIDERAILELDQVHNTDQIAKAALHACAGVSIITHHAGFERLAKRYGFAIAGSVLQGHDEPSPSHIAKLVQLARERGVKAIFREPQYEAAIVSRVAKAASLPVGTLDLLGHGDWHEMIRTNAREVARVSGCRLEDEK
jgi:zinc transport system substrate-binding protein